MTKYVIGALALVAAFLGLFAWGQQGRSQARQALAENKVIATQRDDALEALRLVNRAAEVNRQLSQARVAVAEKQRLAAQAKAKELEHALKDNPDWAASPVPDSVWNALPPGATSDQAAAPGRAAR